MAQVDTRRVDYPSNDNHDHFLPGLLYPVNNGSKSEPLVKTAGYLSRAQEYKSGSN